MEPGSQQLRITENEALIESSFRRLIAAIEAEREKMRSTWTQIEEEQQVTGDDLARLKLDTEEWCRAERLKIENEWKRLDRLRERMSVLSASSREVLDINCSGEIYQLPKRALCFIEGSYLNHMFSDAYIQSVPRDSEGRYFLDFNPECFGIIVDWLLKLEENPEAKVPRVPELQKLNMDLLAEALSLRQFVFGNCLRSAHSTSLKLSGDIVEATHMGWQIISAEHPIKMSGNSYFEIRILKNPDPNTDRICLGLCGHIPTGSEVHTIRIKDAFVYNSNVGLIGDALDANNCQEKIKFVEGMTIGVRHDIQTRLTHFFVNRASIGSCALTQDALERMPVLYPIFGLHAVGQKIEVDFSLSGPLASRKPDEAKALKVLEAMGADESGALGESR
ncbi:unnamed protein product [Durusdinium trenchii]|uniref:B30.2/SPRY domain-containing protein n=2 Tax=Durusdinium trenchii TaxID=1381693 RepID=A0ABP0Q249_9DINO